MEMGLQMILPLRPSGLGIAEEVGLFGELFLCSSLGLENLRTVYLVDGRLKVMALSHPNHFGYITRYLSGLVCIYIYIHIDMHIIHVCIMIYLEKSSV